VQSLQPIHLAALAVAAAAVCALLFAVRHPRVAAATRTWLPRALIAIVGVGSVYALYFREPGVLLAPHDAHALRMFGDLYVTRLALGLAVAGYALVVWRSFWRAPALILTVTALSLFFLYKMRIWPEHFWLARRFLTEILPDLHLRVRLIAPVWMNNRSSKVSPVISGRQPLWGCPFAVAMASAALLTFRTDSPTSPGVIPASNLRPASATGSRPRRLTESL
jgi:hypothetical protein